MNIFNNSRAYAALLSKTETLKEVLTTLIGCEDIEITDGYVMDLKQENIVGNAPLLNIMPYCVYHCILDGKKINITIFCCSDEAESLMDDAVACAYNDMAVNADKKKEVFFLFNFTADDGFKDGINTHTTTLSEDGKILPIVSTMVNYSVNDGSVIGKMCRLLTGQIDIDNQFPAISAVNNLI